MLRRFLPAILALAACGAPEPPREQNPHTVQSFIPPDSAQPAEPASKGPRPEPVLLPGDLIRITVFRQSDLDLEVRVPDTGAISYPLIGAVQAVGKSPSALERDIREKLEKDYLENPSVSVTVKEYSKRKVFIVGAVTKPDGYEMAPDARLTVFQLVATAGGFTERAYKEYVQVIRRQGASERRLIRLSLVDVERRMARGETDADLELWPDDLVVIPSAVRVAFVLGAVQKPGPLEVPVNARLTVSMAISGAGSYTKFAATGRVQVHHHTPSGQVTTKTVDLDAILDGRDDLDIELEPGDVVWVPERGIF
jgi:polysaccharide export outer membrane protein